MDLNMLFEDSSLAPMFAEESTPTAALEQIDKMKAITEDNIQEMKAARKAYKEKMKKRDDAEFYAVVVFASREDQEKFMVRIGEDVTSRYVDSRRVMSHMLQAPQT
jgi:hypothetical protein